MTPRETMIEAMARTILWNAWPIPEGKIDSDFFDLMKKANPEWWAINQQDATTALNALLAALPALGLKVVPVEATKEQWDAVLVSCTSGYHPNITDKVSIQDLRTFFYEMARSFHEIRSDLLGGGE